MHVGLPCAGQYPYVWVPDKYERSVNGAVVGRETGIKVAESVSHVAPTRAAGTSSPVHAASPDGTLTSRVGTRSTAAAKKATPAATKKATPAATKKATPAATKKAAPAIAKMSTPATTKKATPAAAKKATPAAPKNQSTATPKNQSTAAPKKATPAARAANRRTAEPKKAAPMATDSATGVHDATSRSPTRSDTSSNDSVDADSDDSSGDWPSPVTFSAKGTADSSMEIDRSVSPADTVKKRRRTAAWKIGLKIDCNRFYQHCGVPETLLRFVLLLAEILPAPVIEFLIVVVFLLSRGYLSNSFC
ncbi:hypothetical protein RHGRI_009122 [Rhododendron griersonianum]|uniref:Uncharacterized protein n=1 Tax=Rhododendron griersonianum TaxID=479676 RepID=A0AAV6L317_9ERIC|nr:hypothetical protein RHGRI_009122 [Rhododendron griersonianum]